MRSQPQGDALMLDGPIDETAGLWRCSAARRAAGSCSTSAGVKFINSLGVRDWIRMQASATQQGHPDRAAPRRRGDHSPAQHDHRDAWHRARDLVLRAVRLRRLRPRRVAAGRRGRQCRRSSPAPAAADDVPRVRRADGVQRLPRALLLVPVPEAKAYRCTHSPSSSSTWSLGWAIPGVFLLVMLESTLVPIPSELVFPFAGYLASKGVFSLCVMLVINSAAALIGSGIGYWIGAAGGKPLLLQYGKFVLIRKHDIEKTEKYSRTTARRRSSSPGSCRSSATSFPSRRASPACHSAVLPADLPRVDALGILSDPARVLPGRNWEASPTS